jgi:hypothetical protein
LLGGDGDLGEVAGASTVVAGGDESSDELVTDVDPLDGRRSLREALECL